MNAPPNEQGLELILGGARSGKSRLAEERALASGCKKLIYIATAEAGDGEMADRIRHHQQRRGDRWQLVEAPLNLAHALERHQGDDHCLLVDCLTLWLSNCLAADSWQAEREALLSRVAHLRGRIIFVSNEVGSGIVPPGELSRRFADESGLLHQNLAQACRRVSLVVAGLPLELKSEG